MGCCDSKPENSNKADSKKAKKPTDPKALKKEFLLLRKIVKHN